MAESAPTSGKVNQVDGVLQDYLDQLLVTATEVRSLEATGVATEQVVENSIADVLTEVNEEKPSVVVTDDAELQTVTELPELELPNVTEELVAAAHQAPPQEPATELDWNSSQGVECLIFKVSGLKLAIPLPVLGGVHKIEDEITPLFGQVSWALGVWQTDDIRLSIVDSADLIMPERGMKLARDGFSYAIQLERTPWALACQEICDTITLQRSSIKWRGQKGKRQWLAGTVISEMCALLDVPGLLAMLEQQRFLQTQS